MARTRRLVREAGAGRTAQGFAHAVCACHGSRAAGAAGLPSPLALCAPNPTHIPQIPIYDFKTSRRVGYRHQPVPEARVVIVEGIYALSERLRPLMVRAGLSRREGAGTSGLPLAQWQARETVRDARALC